jgi:hypothetical protein
MNRKPRAKAESRKLNRKPRAKAESRKMNRKPRAKRREPRGNVFRPKLIVEYSYIASSFQYFSSYNFRLVDEFILIPHSEGEFYSSKSEGAKASTRQLIVTLTFERTIEAFPIFQLIDVSVPDENNPCSVFQMVANGHNTFVESKFFNDDSFQLVVELISMSNSEGVRATPNHSSQLIVASINSEISFHFCDNCRIFCEGVKGATAIPNGLFGRNLAFGLISAFGYITVGCCIALQLHHSPNCLAVADGLIVKINNLQRT